MAEVRSGREEQFTNQDTNCLVCIVALTKFTKHQNCSKAVKEENDSLYYFVC